MRILHVHDSPHILGGATQYLHQLVEVMAGRGHRNAIFSLDEEAGDLPAQTACYRYQRAKSALVRRRQFGRFHEPLAEALRRFMDEFQPEVVHVQNLVPFRTTVFPTLAAYGVPPVMTVHDYTLASPDPPGRAPRRGILAPLRRALDRSQVRRGQQAVLAAVRTFLCPTRALLEATPFPAGRARLLRLPVAQAEAPPLPPAPLQLFFAGTLYDSKGVDVLLRALATAGGPAAEARLAIAGSGDREEALRALAGELGLTERVQWLGRCDAGGMEAAYARSSLLVLPSRVPENSPLTVLEAGARGRPSAASHAGGVPELLEPPARGWTFPSEDHAALRAILEEAAAAPAEVAARGARMRAWVRAECDPEQHWNAVEATYQEHAR